MSIRDYLDGTQFDGETIRQMGIAFEMALASLAQHGERDPDRLCEGALQAVSPAVQRDSSPVQPE